MDDEIKYRIFRTYWLWSLVISHILQANPPTEGDK